MSDFKSLRTLKRVSFNVDLFIVDGRVNHCLVSCPSKNLEGEPFFADNAYCVPTVIEDILELHAED